MKFKVCSAALAMAAVLMVGATSCDDDDDNKKNDDDLLSVVGTYAGNALYVFPYMPDGMSYTDLNVVVTRHENDDDDVDVNMNSTALGNYTFADIDVVKTEAGYTLLGNGEVLMSRARYGKPDTTYAATIDAVIVSADEFEFSFYTPDVMGGSTLVVKSVKQTPAYSISGRFNGQMAWNVNGQDYGDAFEATVSLTKLNEASVAINVPAMSANERMTTVPFTIPNVTAAVDDDGNVVLLETDYNLTVTTDSEAGTTMNYRGSVISGSLNDGKITLQFSLTPGAMPMPIVCTFTQK